jgi:hypothetical protein
MIPILKVSVWVERGALKLALVIIQLKQFVQVPVQLSLKNSSGGEILHGDEIRSIPGCLGTRVYVNQNSGPEVDFFTILVD